MEAAQDHKTTRTGKALRNFWAHLVAQALIFAFALILPKTLIANYGSDVNGLLSSISQLFTYAALVEAGIGTAAIQAFFRYVGKNKNDDINSLMFRARSFYRKASVIYLAAIILLTVLYPLVVKTSTDYWTVFFVMLIQGITGVIPFVTYSPFSMFLQAEGKSYVISWFGVAARIITTVGKIIMYSLGVNIVVVQVIWFMVTIVEVIAFYIYKRKYYPWLGYKNTPNGPKLDGAVAYTINAASKTVMSSTDTVVLSILVSTSASSVYSIYALVFVTLQGLLQGFLLGNFALGQTYHEDKAKYLKLHSALESFIMFVTTGVMTTACCLAIPFIRLYTQGVTDVDYIDTVLPFLFVLPILFVFGYSVPTEAEMVSGHPRQVAIQSGIEAIINLGLTVPFVLMWGIRGALLATCIATLIRLAMVLFYSNVRVLSRSPWESVKPILICIILFFAFSVPMSFIDYRPRSYIEWILLAVITTIVVMTVFALSFFLSRNEQAVFVLNSFKLYLTKGRQGVSQNQDFLMRPKKPSRSIICTLGRKRLRIRKLSMLLCIALAGTGMASMLYWTGTQSQRVQLHSKLMELDRLEHLSESKDFYTHLEFVKSGGFEYSESVAWQKSADQHRGIHSQSYYVWGEDNPVEFSTDLQNTVLSTLRVASVAAYSDKEVMEGIFLPLYKKGNGRVGIMPQGGADVGCYISMQAANDIVASGLGPASIESFFETPFIFEMADQSGKIIKASVNNIYCSEKGPDMDQATYDAAIALRGDYPRYFAASRSNYIFAYNSRLATQYKTIRVVDALPYYAHARNALSYTCGFDYGNQGISVNLAIANYDGSEKDVSDAVNLDASSFGSNVFSGINIFAFLGAVLLAGLFLWLSASYAQHLSGVRALVVMRIVALCAWPLALGNAAAWFAVLLYPHLSLFLSLAFNPFGSLILLLIGLVLATLVVLRSRSREHTL